MKTRWLKNRRTRLRLMLLVVLSLLGQQVALASYPCPTADMPVGNAAMSMHCDGMSMLQQKQAPSLCAQHCAQQPPATQDAQLPHVPYLFMPALLPSPLALTTTYASGTLLRSESASPVSGLPPSLRFRVLLI
ncbi:MAG: hypothetical protein EPN69_03345 [Rhodanobacter sp.]|nr:MAG: hypothetical protein EPN69_03345 [Rhodanobacter sp.]TAM40995.1 MAG: hypothetical protein EPN58_08925 [Rhodanobacter sp.]